MIKSLSENIKNGLKEVHSFDLCSHKKFIKAADIKNVPLESSSCNVVVLCLSLMGTNFIDFLHESRRLLKIDGNLLVTEICSRIVD